MAAGISAVRVLVLPIFQRHWLYHAWVEGAHEAATVSAAIDWRKGQNLHEQLQLLRQQVAGKIQTSVSSKWRQLETSHEGTFQNRLYRLAKYVLSREDPLETTLKAFPSNCQDLEIIYPASLNPLLVRRRTRRMAQLRAGYHERRMVGWMLSCIPQAPLALTPLPNVTLYYCVYKAVSHYQARNGAKALHRLFVQHDLQQFKQMQEMVIQLAKEGRTFPPGSWPEKLLSKDPGQLDLVARLEHDARQQMHLDAEPLVVQPLLRGDQELDAIVKPTLRLHTPLGDEAVLTVSQHFSLPHLPELVSRFRAKVLKDKS